MVSNIDIFQGIVSKLEIPVSWQHYNTPWYVVNEWESIFFQNGASLAFCNKE